MILHYALAIFAAMMMTTPTAQATGMSCDSLDETLQKMKFGISTTQDFLNTLDCHLKNEIDPHTLCSTHVGVHADLVKIAKARFQIGEVTRTEVRAAEQALDDAQALCKD